MHLSFLKKAPTHPPTFNVMCGLTLRSGSKDLICHELSFCHNVGSAQPILQDASQSFKDRFCCLSVETVIFFPLKLAKGLHVWASVSVFSKFEEQHNGRILVSEEERIAMRV